MVYSSRDVYIGNDYANRNYCALARLSPRIEERFLTVGVNALRLLTFRSDGAVARAEIEKFAHDVLSNPVIEDYLVEIVAN